MRLCIMYMYGPWIASFIAQVIQWVKDTGSSHVEITTPSVNEQEAQEMLGQHRTFMETDATVRSILSCAYMCVSMKHPHVKSSANLTVTKVFCTSKVTQDGSILTCAQCSRTATVIIMLLKGDHINVVEVLATVNNFVVG